MLSFNTHVAAPVVWLMLNECHRYPRAHRSGRSPILVFSAYVLISSARVEMSNKFVTLYPGNPHRSVQMWIINDSPAYLDGPGSTKLHYVEVPTWEKNYGETIRRGHCFLEGCLLPRRRFLCLHCFVLTSLVGPQTWTPRWQLVSKLLVDVFWRGTHGARTSSQTKLIHRHTSAALPFTCIFRLNHWFTVYSRVSFGNENFR